MHAANLTLRFLLELAALAGFGTLVWSIAQGAWRYAAALLAVVLIGALWVTFAVPDDPSRSGNAPVPVPGALRLMLEWAILLGGAAAFYAAGNTWTGFAIGGLVIFHYALWPERIGWLLQH